MSTQSKEIIEFIGAEYEAELERIQKEHKLVELVDIEKNNTPSTYAVIGQLLEAIKKNADCEYLERAFEELKHCEEKLIRMRASLFTSSEVSKTGVTVCYLCIGSENISDLAALINGKDIKTAIIVRFEVKS